MRILFGLAWLGLLLSALCLPARAWAEEESEQAKAHYQIGAAAYQTGQFELAAKEFRTAYALSKKAPILWDIARAESRLGHDEIAVDFLKQYVKADPGSPDIPSVTAEIEARERAIEEHKQKTRAEVEREVARRQSEGAQRQAALSAKQSEAAQREAHRRPRWPGYALVAGGAAILAVGIAFNVVAPVYANQVSDGGKPTPVPFSSGFSSKESVAKIGAPLGIAFDAIGGACLAAGIGLWIWGRPHSEAPRASLTPSLGGLAMTGAF